MGPDSKPCVMSLVTQRKKREDCSTLFNFLATFSFWLLVPLEYQWQTFGFQFLQIAETLNLCLIIFLADKCINKSRKIKKETDQVMVVTTSRRKHGIKHGWYEPVPLTFCFLFFFLFYALSFGCQTTQILFIVQWGWMQPERKTLEHTESSERTALPPPLYFIRICFHRVMPKRTIMNDKIIKDSKTLSRYIISHIFYYYYYYWH